MSSNEYIHYFCSVWHGIKIKKFRRFWSFPGLESSIHWTCRPKIIGGATVTSHSVEVTVCFWTGTTHFATKAKMGLQQFYLATFGLILMQGKLIVRVLLMFCACYLLDVDFVRISPVNSTHRSIQGWRHVFGGNPIIRFWLLWNREWNIWKKK